MKDLNLTNQTFGRLKVVELLYHTTVDRYWKCSCLCGRIVTIRESKLIGGAKSCGCHLIAHLPKVIPIKAPEALEKNDQQEHLEVHMAAAVKLASLPINKLSLKNLPESVVRTIFLTIAFISTALYLWSLTEPVQTFIFANAPIYDGIKPLPQSFMKKGNK